MTFKVEGVNKSFGALMVLNDLSIAFEKDKLTCILGPSGCGKTTILNILTGLDSLDSGKISGFDEQAISVVFQEDRLVPWLNVEDNLMLVLKDNMPFDKALALIKDTLDEFKLSEYLGYYPRELSGGIRRRISMLRAFMYPSNVLLMDEPFTSLDINTKKEVIEFLKELLSSTKKTCVLVTHNIDEALELGDKIVVLSNKPTSVKRVFSGCVDKNEIENEMTSSI